MFFRRQHALEREHRVYIAREDEFLQQKMMYDQHHERIMSQIERERQRHLDEIQKVELQREAKKRINAELRARLTENQEREREREEGRWDRMRAVRESREQLVLQQKQEQQELLLKRQVRTVNRLNVQISYLT